MFEFEYDLSHRDARKHNPKFGKIKIVDMGSNVFLIKGKNASGKTVALETLRRALGADPAGLPVPARLKLASLDGKISLISSIDPGMHSTINGKPADYSRPGRFDVVYLDLGRAMSLLDEYAWYLHWAGVKRMWKRRLIEKTEMILMNVDRINSSRGILLLDNTGIFFGGSELDNFIKHLKNLIKKKRLMAAVITDNSHNIT